MSVGPYLDVNFDGPTAAQLRNRGVVVVRAVDDGFGEASDEDVLSRAIELGMLAVSEDRDFRILAARWQRDGRPFCGVVAILQRRWQRGRLVRDLATFALAGELADFENRVLYL